MAGTDSSGAREAALHRLTRVKRWIVAGSVTLAGALTAVFANAFPGRTVHGSGGAQGSSSSPASPQQAPQQEGEQREQEAPSIEQGEAAQPSAEAPVISGGS